MNHHQEWTERLALAAQEGNASAISESLAHGGDPNTINSFGRTPMHWAAMHGFIGSLQEMIACHGDIQAEDRWKTTPLHCAAMVGQLEVCRFLIGQGAQILALDQRGRVPLDVLWASPHAKTEGFARTAVFLMREMGLDLTMPYKGETLIERFHDALPEAIRAIQSGIAAQAIGEGFSSLGNELPGVVYSPPTKKKGLVL